MPRDKFGENLLFGNPYPGGSDSGYALKQLRDQSATLKRIADQGARTGGTTGTELSVNADSIARELAPGIEAMQRQGDVMNRGLSGVEGAVQGVSRDLRDGLSGVAGGLTHLGHGVERLGTQMALSQSAIKASIESSIISQAQLLGAQRITNDRLFQMMQVAIAATYELAGIREGVEGVRGDLSGLRGDFSSGIARGRADLGVQAELSREGNRTLGEISGSLGGMGETLDDILFTGQMNGSVLLDIRNDMRLAAKLKVLERAPDYHSVVSIAQSMLDAGEIDRNNMHLLSAHITGPDKSEMLDALQREPSIVQRVTQPQQRALDSLNANLQRLRRQLSDTRRVLGSTISDAIGAKSRITRAQAEVDRKLTWGEILSKPPGVSAMGFSEFSSLQFYFPRKDGPKNYHTYHGWVVRMRQMRALKRAKESLKKHERSKRDYESGIAQIEWEIASCERQISAATRELNQQIQDFQGTPARYARRPVSKARQVPSRTPPKKEQPVARSAPPIEPEPKADSLVWTVADYNSVASLAVEIPISMQTPVNEPEQVASVNPPPPSRRRSRRSRPPVPVPEKVIRADGHESAEAADFWQSVREHSAKNQPRGLGRGNKSDD